MVNKLMAAAAATSATAVTAATILTVPATAAGAAVSFGPTPGVAPHPAAGPVPGRTAYGPGSAGVGDPYFPGAGNGGYDVEHYDIRLGYRPQGNRIAGTTVITATATQDLSRFNLDFAGDRVSRVTVEGAAAAHRRRGQELIVTPRAGIPEGARFTVAVTYDGSPSPGRDPGLGKTGWIRTPDGAVTLSQPVGSATWFPLNDHPSDKAAHTYTITVPDGLSVVANGEPAGTFRQAGGRTRTFRWQSRHPMAGYLAMVAIGRFRTVDGRTPGGIRSISAVDSSLKGDDLARLHRTTGQVTDWGVRMFGAFPFDSTGGVIDDVKVGYALETQNRPVYPGSAGTSLIVHELAHQWFGDSVSLRSWQDIWLNEGFASYAEWLWSEQHGGPTAARMFDRAYKPSPGDKMWRRPTGAPGRKGMFDFFPVYTRGAMTLHALRTAVGDPAFFRILRTWATSNAHGGVTTEDFIRHSERVSGLPVRALLQEWLYKTGKPERPKSLTSPGRIATEPRLNGGPTAGTFGTHVTTPQGRGR
ncbi:M1 family metallopeptidase [Actinomadura viridis]|uniref:M1 family metallopeptidase n=1 Tax=Actinomadura viridis TaxID=58110 RepID=UPI003680C0C2